MDGPRPGLVRWTNHSRIMPRALARLTAPCAIVLVLVAVVHGMLTYEDALKKAVSGESDDSVLAAFWREHHQAEQEGNTQRIKSIKINLGALLLDLANGSKDRDSYMAMYEECEKISQELLAIDVSM
jgi:hypothetical protein